MYKMSGFIVAASLIGAVPALAQMAPTEMDASVSAGSSSWMPGHEPHSRVASNIIAGRATTDYAPALPPPPAGDDASVGRLLRDAGQALDQNRTGAAQEALERAETRLLDRSVPLNGVGVPDRNPVVSAVTEARLSLGHGDIPGSKAAIGRATAALAMAHGSMTGRKS